MSFLPPPPRVCDIVSFCSGVLFFLLDLHGLDNLVFAGGSSYATVVSTAHSSSASGLHSIEIHCYNGYCPAKGKLEAVPGPIS